VPDLTSSAPHHILDLDSSAAAYRASGIALNSSYRLALLQRENLPSCS
jgi:hypothetical protein